MNGQNPFTSALSRFKAQTEASDTVLEEDEDEVDMGSIFRSARPIARTNYAKDRRLAGKKRVKARKAQQRAERVS